MPIEAAFAELEKKAGVLQQKVKEMSAPLLKDRPRHDVPHLLQKLDEAVIDLREAVAAAAGAAARGNAAAQHPADVNAVRHALMACHARFLQAWELFDDRFTSTETITELLGLGQEKKSVEEREQWSKWRESLQQGIQQCRAPFHEMSRALGACWQEIAERAGAVTNIGQQIQMSARPEATWEDNT